MKVNAIKTLCFAFAVGTMTACNAPQVTYESISVEAWWRAQRIYDQLRGSGHGAPTLLCEDQPSSWSFRGAYIYG